MQSIKFYLAGWGEAGGRRLSSRSPQASCMSLGGERGWVAGSWGVTSVSSPGIACSWKWRKPHGGFSIGTEQRAVTTQFSVVTEMQVFRSWKQEF